MIEEALKEKWKWQGIFRSRKSGTEAKSESAIVPANQEEKTSKWRQLVDIFHSYREIQRAEAKAKPQDIARPAGREQAIATKFAAKEAKARAEEKEQEREAEEARKKDAKDKPAQLTSKPFILNIGGGSSSSAGAGSLASSSSFSILLIVLGMIHFLIKVYLPLLAPYSFLFSVVLLLIAGYALAMRLEQDRVAMLVALLAFVVWYFVYDSRIDILLPLGIIILVLSSVLGILTKGQSLKPELFGFFPVLFFFLDIGLIPFFVERLHIPLTTLMQNLILFMPWWALFGILTLPADVGKSPTTNLFVNGLRVVGILYLVFIFAAPNFSYFQDISLLPVAGEIAQAEQQVRERLAGRENSFISNVKCILKITGFTPGTTSIQQCVQERQEMSEIEALCKNQGLTGQSDIDTCVKEEQTRRKSALHTKGTEDPTIRRPTTAQFVIVEEFFPKQSIRPKTGTFSITYPATLDLQNPRRQSINVKIECTFKKGTETVIGQVTTGTEGTDFLTVAATDNKIPVVCTPSTELDGKYQLLLQAHLSNLKTPSYLKRVFLGEKTEEERSTWVEKIRRTVITSPQDTITQAPAEFARLNFAFGRTPQDPYIAASDPILLSASIEDSGKGKIERIHGYAIQLLEEGFSVRSGDITCLQGGDSEIKVALEGSRVVQKVYSLPTCFLELPDSLKVFEDPFQVKTFFAELRYDYRINKEIPVEVKVIE